MTQRPPRRMAASRSSPVADWPSPDALAAVSDLPSAVSATTSNARASNRASKPAHRVTIRKTPQQVARLQEAWLRTRNPTKEERERLAEEIHLDVRIVSTWFRDERSKVTRMRAEQDRGSGPVRHTRVGAKFRSNPIARTTPASDSDADDEEHVEDAPYVPRSSTIRSLNLAPIRHVSPQPEITLTDTFDRTKPFSPYHQASPSLFPRAHDSFSNLKVPPAPGNQYQYTHGRPDMEFNYAYTRHDYGPLSPSAPSPPSNDDSSSSFSGYDSDPREFSAPLPPTPNYPLHSFTSPRIANNATPSPVQPAARPLQPATGISFGFERYCSSLNSYKPPKMLDPWRWGAYDKISSMRQTLRNEDDGGDVNEDSSRSPRVFNAATMT